VTEPEALTPAENRRRINFLRAQEGEKRGAKGTSGLRPTKTRKKGKG
jgi:hypothetical protein